MDHMQSFFANENGLEHGRENVCSHGWRKI